MTFPTYLHVFGLRVHPHLVMELLAYSGGFQLYRYLRPRFPRAAVPFEQNVWLLVGAIFGALIGSKLLAWLESWPEFWPHRSDPLTWIGGKTIVGGLLGGWAGVEWAKRYCGIRHSTGDVYVFPLILGQCLGRVGCFLTGLDDHTYGNFTRAAWAVDFGDGPRHPTQLYEIMFLVLLGVMLFAIRRSYRPTLPNGTLFRLYLAGYLLFRFGVEFIKPTWKPYLGLSAIQVASLIGVIVCIVQVGARLRSGQRDGDQALGTTTAQGIA